MVSKSGLRVSRLIKAAKIAEAALPEIAERLVHDVHDPEIPLKERNSAVRTLLDMAQAGPRMQDHLGLRDTGKSGGAGSLIAVLGQEVNILELRGMSPEAREEFLLKLASGNKHEALKMIPTEAKVV